MIPEDQYTQPSSAVLTNTVTWAGVGPAGKIGSWTSIPNRDLETVALSFLGTTFKGMASGPGIIELFQAGI